MMKKKVIVFIVIFIIVNFLFGIDDLSKYKLEVQDRFKPGTGNMWINIDFDKSFKFENESVESFLKTPSCVKIINDRIVVIDNNLHKLNIYSLEGKFEKSIGQLGTGPGDLFYPFWLDFFNGETFVRSNNGIDIFDKNLTFRKRIRIFFSSPLFSVYENNIYLSILDGYREKYPLFVKLDMSGRVKEIALDEDMQDPYLRKHNNSFILFSSHFIMVVPKNWNRIYLFDHNLKLVNKIKINYPMLDMIETWNKREIYNKKDSRITWPCNMIASAKFCRDEFYFLLNIPRLEIITIDLKNGNVKNHYFNIKDFKFMRWTDFDVQYEKEKDQIAFYVMGNSLVDNEKNPEFLEYNVFKIVLKNEQRFTPGENKSPVRSY